MTDIEKLAWMDNLLQEMSGWLIHFDNSFSELLRRREEFELSLPFEKSGAEEQINQLWKTLMECRQQIMARQHDVTTFLTSVHLPVQWVITPAPAIGGSIETHNIFDAFIAVTGDVDPRPNLIQMTDLLHKGRLACERLLRDHKKYPLVEQVETASPPAQSRKLTISITGIIGFVSSLVEILLLFPTPSIEREDILLGINTPFGTQFAIKNNSPWFDMYIVQPSCVFNRVVVGNTTLTRVSSTSPPITDELGAGTTFDVDCRFGVDPVFSHVSEADLTLDIIYKWFRVIPRHKQQRFILGVSEGKHVWIPKGS